MWRKRPRNALEDGGWFGYVICLCVTDAIKYMNQELYTK